VERRILAYVVGQGLYFGVNVGGDLVAFGNARLIGEDDNLKAFAVELLKFLLDLGELGFPVSGVRRKPRSALRLNQSRVLSTKE